MEDNKTSTKTNYRSPILCCSRVSRSTLNPMIRTVSISAIVVLFLLAIGLALGGVLSGGPSSRSYYIASLFFVLMALLLLNVFLWIWKRYPVYQSSKNSSSGPESGVATISSFDYYNQVPPDHKTDYPMGPYLVLTLPRPSRSNWKQEPSAEEGGTKSIPSTPGFALHKYPRNKNLPPLASAETLSPSLQSSYGSIDSVV